MITPHKTGLALGSVVTASLTLVFFSTIHFSSAAGPSDYITTTFHPVTFSKTSINDGEIFTATIGSKGICIKDVPKPSVANRFTYRYLAINGSTGEEATLNPSYVVTVQPFPQKVGETYSVSNTVPLQFPPKSTAGTYTIVEEIIKVEMKDPTLGWQNAPEPTKPPESTKPSKPAKPSTDGGGTNDGGTKPSKPSEPTKPSEPSDKPAPPKTRREIGMVAYSPVVVTPPILISTLTISPTAVIGGEASVGTVTLSSPAPVGGQLVLLSAPRGTPLILPDRVMVNPGARSGAFRIRTYTVTASVTVPLTATFANSNVSKTAQLRINPKTTSSSSSSSSFSSSRSSSSSSSSTENSTVLFDDFNGTTKGKGFGTVTYEDHLPDMGKAVNLAKGRFIKYSFSPWYKWDRTHKWNRNEASPGTLTEGRVDMWIKPRQYTGIVTFNWSDASSTPAAGYILHLGFNADGKLTYSVWGGHMDTALVGKTTVPLNKWSRIAVSWGPKGTKLHLNGNVDASTDASLWPAFSGTVFAYLNYWGASDLGLVDDFRISKRDTLYSSSSSSSPSFSSSRSSSSSKSSSSSSQSSAAGKTAATIDHALCTVLSANKNVKHVQVTFGGSVSGPVNVMAVFGFTSGVAAEQFSCGTWTDTSGQIYTHQCTRMEGQPETSTWNFVTAPFTQAGSDYDQTINAIVPLWARFPYVYGATYAGQNIKCQ